MSLRLILKEQSENDFVTKYKNKFSNEILTTIIHWFDPKEWMWIGKNLDAGSDLRDLEELLVLIRSYKRLSKYLQTPQLDLFDSIISLKKQIKSFNEEMLKGLKIEEDVNRLVDNQDVKILELKTKEQICYYLSEVEECKFSPSFNSVLEGNKVVFILIDKKTNKKIGIVFTKKAVNPIKFYLFNDTEYAIYDNLESLKTAIDIPGIDLYYSLLLYFVELSFENLKNFDLEIFKKENRVNEFKRLDKIKKYNINSEIQERRKNNEWELDEDCPIVGLMAHAVYEFLVSEGILTKISDEELERKKELIQKIDELQSQYDADEEVRYDLYDQINDLEEELDEINEEYSDVYDVIPQNSYYEMTLMTCTKCDDEEYAVGTYDELQDSVATYFEEYVDDIGFDNLGDSIIENAIDEDHVVDYFYDFYQDDLNNEPENYIDESERQLSSEQDNKIERAQYNIRRTEIQLEKLTDILSNTEYGENYEKLENRITELEDYLSTLQDFIDEINENPEGDFPQDKIDDAFDALISDVRYDPLGKLKEWDMELEHFVDKERVIELLKEDGGDEMFARVDGVVYEEKVIDTWYYIVKI